MVQLIDKMARTSELALRSIERASATRSRLARASGDTILAKRSHVMSPPAVCTAPVDSIRASLHTRSTCVGGCSVYEEPQSGKSGMTRKVFSTTAEGMLNVKADNKFSDKFCLESQNGAHSRMSSLSSLHQESWKVKEMSTGAGAWATPSNSVCGSV